MFNKHPFVGRRVRSVQQVLHDGLEQVETSAAQSINREDEADSIPSVAATEGIPAAMVFLRANRRFTNRSRFNLP